MLRLDNDKKAFCIEDSIYHVGNIGVQPFLDSGAVRHHFDNSYKVGKTGDLIHLRDISDMHLAEKREKMVLTHREEGNIPSDDKLVFVGCGV